jgi:hypothetical protein
MAGLEDPGGLTGRRGDHAAVCLRCQAEAAKYRRLRRGLAGLAGVVELAPAEIAASIRETVAQESEPEMAPGRLAGVAAAGAAAFVAAGTVVVLRRIRGAA